MANPTCTVASFTAGAACFKPYGAAQRQSILVYYLTQELAANGGTDYTAQLGSGGTLEAAALCFRNLPWESCPPSVYELLIAYNNAISAGASAAAAGSDALEVAIQCNKNFPEADKSAQILFLYCSLGRHADYPQ